MFLFLFILYFFFYILLLRSQCMPLLFLFLFLCSVLFDAHHHHLISTIIILSVPSSMSTAAYQLISIQLHHRVRPVSSSVVRFLPLMIKPQSSFFFSIIGLPHFQHPIFLCCACGFCSKRATPHIKSIIFYFFFL